MKASGSVEITVLGSGTSVGIPMVGCTCAVCRSNDPRDQRLRCSVLIRHEGRNILVDTTPDFRQQALRINLDRLDGILITHAHADHVMGLDDIRPFNFWQKRPIPLYGSPETLGALERIFSYIFRTSEKQSAVPKIETHAFDEDSFDLCGLEIQPVRVHHGSDCKVHGFRVGGAAYLTDHNQIPEESLDKLRGLEVLFLDALRHKPHPTHSTVERSLGYSVMLNAKCTYFTHISHDLAHAETEKKLPPNVRLAYDGLKVTARASY